MAATATAKAKTTKAETVTASTSENVKEVKNETVLPNEKTVVKNYKSTDGIPCKSITPGKLFMEGLKSHIVYRWVDNGDVIDVEYQDIIAAIRSNSGYIMKPFFVIEDKDLVSQYPQLGKIYDALYSVGDLKSVLTNLRPEDMRATILSLPEGAKESIKHLASDMISKGTLDSVKKIKYLDEIYDTELMLMTGLFNE